MPYTHEMTLAALADHVTDARFVVETIEKSAPSPERNARLADARGVLAAYEAWLTRRQAAAADEALRLARKAMVEVAG